MLNWLELSHLNTGAYLEKVMGLSGCAQGKGQVMGSCFWKLCHFWKMWCSAGQRKVLGRNK